MKGIVRRLTRFATFGVIALLGLPVALLIPAAFLDRGPLGNVRASLFPVALAIFDPYVWTCVGNSLMIAAIVTAGSLGLGLALARTVSPWRFWGRPPLVSMAWMPLAVAPAFAAVGMVSMLSPIALGRSLTRFSGRELFLGTAWERWVSWTLLIWVGLASATPVVALSVIAVLGRVAPSWSDAGRALGATRRQVWRQLVWPIVRPEVARTLASVFATALLEPGAPMILGLRRTLAFAMVEAVWRSDDSTRAAALALIGLALALLGRFAIRGWGGGRVTIAQSERLNWPRRASGWRASASIVGLVAWSAFGLAPLVGLLGTVIGAFDPKTEGGWVVSVTTLVSALIDPDTLRLAINALELALVVTLLDALLVAMNTRATLALYQRSRPPSLTILAFERTPPLVFGMAAALLPGLMSRVADRFGLSVLDQLAGWLDPIRWPGVLLIASTAATRLPTLARASDRAELRTRPALAEAALSLGESSRRAIRLGGGRGPGLGVLILTFALAATSVAPAIVLTPSTRTRTVGPGVVLITDDRPKVAGLALGAVGLNLIGLVAARKGRSGPAGDWFRG